MKPLRTLIFFALIVGLAATFGCGGSQPAEDEPKVEETTQPPAVEPPPPVEPAVEPPPPETAPQTKAAPKAQPKAPAKSNPVVIFETSNGRFKIELFEDKAPVTVANFLQYVDEKFYDGTIFHRVIPNFMVQGGGHLPDMTEKPTRASIKNEADNGLANLRGTVAMARKRDPHSASAQFFVNHGRQNEFLNKASSDDGWGYCVFGKIVDGMDIVDAIAAVPTTTRGPYQNVPAEAVVVKTARRAK